MLTLFLLRHAKAVAHGRSEDFDRGLADKGVADARRLGAHMARRELLPDLALVSAADRTKQTFELFAESAGADIRSRYETSLYNASDTQLRDVLKIIDNSIQRLMIVGHNPGIMDVAVRLARDGDIEDLARMRSRFPPGTLAVLGFDCDDWRDARASGGRLDLLLMPDDLTGDD